MDARAPIGSDALGYHAAEFSPRNPSVSDRYLSFSQTMAGQQLSALLGLPSPPRLARPQAGYRAQPLSGYSILLGSDPKAQYAAALIGDLAEAGAELLIDPVHGGLAPLKRAATSLTVRLSGLRSEVEQRLDAIVFDGTGLSGAQELYSVYELLHPHIRRLAANGRVLILAAAAERDPPAAAAAWALRGLVRSLAKELGRHGIAVNGLEVAPVAAGGLAGPLRFFLSEHSAFVTGQTLILDSPADSGIGALVRPLSGRSALVTGAARGIGAAIATTLAREGASVIGVDRPGEEAALAATLAPIDGRALILDITGESAAARIAEYAQSLDIVVHNAGITRDRTLKNLAPEAWDQVLAVNLAAVLNIDRQLLEGVLSPGARLVCIASMNGIAGAAGQTHYAASKAAIMGYVETLAPRLARLGGAVNAVAPGFIETQMTASMPLIPREVGRRLNSFSQGGLPSDVAEAVTFLASTHAVAVNGRTLRVCGQHLIGA